MKKDTKKHPKSGQKFPIAGFWALMQFKMHKMQ